MSFSGSDGSACPIRCFCPYMNVNKPMIMPIPAAPKPYFQPQSIVAVNEPMLMPM